MRRVQSDLSDVIRTHGQQCVNGSNPKLLDHLQLNRLLGEGSFGNVYSGCSPPPCDDTSQQFAIKLARMTTGDFNFPFATNKQPWHEAYILKNLINPLVEQGICPNLPLLMDMFTCNSCDFVFKGKKSRKSCLILITELASGDLASWLSTLPPEDEIYSAIFQIMVGLHAIQYHCQIFNNDVKTPNILYYDVEPGGYWHYIVHGVDYYVPNHGKMFVLNDFGVSMTFDPNHKLTNKVSDRFSDLGARYGMVVGNTFQPLNATTAWVEKSNKIVQMEPNQKLWTQGLDTTTSRPKVARRSEGCPYSFIDLKSDKIYGCEYNFNSEQKSILRKHKIGGSDDKMFYMYPEIIPPFQFKYDTQDAIRMFIGGINREMQPGTHPNHNIPEVIRRQLSRYLDYGSSVHIGPTIPMEPYKVLAGYFIEDFFTRYKRKPSEHILSKYKVS